MIFRGAARIREMLLKMADPTSRQIQRTFKLSDKKIVAAHELVNPYSNRYAEDLIWACWYEATNHKPRQPRRVARRNRKKGGK